MNEKPKIQTRTVGKLIVFAQDCYGKMAASVFLAVIGILCGMIPYFCVARLTSDFFYEEQTMKAVVGWSTLAVLGLLLKMTLTTWSSMKSVSYTHLSLTFLPKHCFCLYSPDVC